MLFTRLGIALMLSVAPGMPGPVTAQVRADTPQEDRPMVMTMLEAQVAPERWDTLRNSYETRARLPESGEIIESFLIQGTSDSRIWRIVTVWRDREALDEMRSSGETPTGVLIFRDAGVEPRLTVYNVWANPRAVVVSPR